jgi:hypothetical protein
MADGDWADIQATRLVGHILKVSVVRALAQALREAEARGMERAAKLVGGFRKITYPEALNATEVGAHNAFVTRLQKAIQEDAGTERQP